MGIVLWGRNFVANYTHDIGAKHWWEYSTLGYNLKQLEQQVVENLMRTLKMVWHNQTSRGGPECVSKGVYRAAPRARRLFEFISRKYGWHAGHLQKVLDHLFFRAADGKTVADAPFELDSDPDNPDSSDDAYDPGSDDDAGDDQYCAFEVAMEVEDNNSVTEGRPSDARLAPERRQLRRFFFSLAPGPRSSRRARPRAGQW